MVGCWRWELHTKDHAAAQRRGETTTGYSKSNNARQPKVHEQGAKTRTTLFQSKRNASFVNLRILNNEPTTSHTPIPLPDPSLYLLPRTTENYLKGTFSHLFRQIVPRETQQVKNRPCRSAHDSEKIVISSFTLFSLHSLRSRSGCWVPT